VGHFLKVDFTMTHQKENGYVQIANTLIESMAQTKMPGNCWRVVFWVLRNTYGFNRKSTNKTSVRQIGRIIGMDSTSVDRSVRWLISEGIISETSESYSLLKSYFPYPTLPQERGTLPQERGTLPQERGTLPQERGTLPQERGTLNYKKDNLKDNLKDTVSFSKFWEIYPKKKFRAYALKAWLEKAPPLDKCLSALTWQISSEDWKNPAFIPNPAKWIEGECWNDIPPGHDIVKCSVCGTEGALPHGTRGTPICRKCKEAEKEKVYELK
jgi:phage replication O-like protein O